MKRQIIILTSVLAIYLLGLAVLTGHYNFNIFTASRNILPADKAQGSFDPLPLVDEAKVNDAQPLPEGLQNPPEQDLTQSATPQTDLGEGSYPELQENLLPVAAQQEAPQPAPQAEQKPALPKPEVPVTKPGAGPFFPFAKAQQQEVKAEKPATEVAEVKENKEVKEVKEEPAPAPEKKAEEKPKPKPVQKAAAPKQQKKVVEEQPQEQAEIIYVEREPVKKSSPKTETKKQPVKEPEIKVIVEEKPKAPEGPQTLADADLVDIMTLPVKPFLDIRYAAADNFMEEKLYPSSKCYLKRNAANALMRAIMYANEAPVPFTLCVYDCYRPLSVQKRMWAKMPNSGYIASPSIGSNHNRGTAVDAGPCSLEGNPLPAPTDFDEFIPAAASDAGSNIVAPAALKNREALQEIMKKAGFTTIKKEWWHFDFRGAENYPTLDIPFGK